MSEKILFGLMAEEKPQLNGICRSYSASGGSLSCGGVWCKGVALAGQNPCHGAM